MYFHNYLPDAELLKSVLFVNIYVDVYSIHDVTSMTPVIQVLELSGCLALGLGCAGLAASRKSGYWVLGMKNGSKNLNAALMDQIVHGCGHIYSPCCSALFWLSSLAQIIALAKARSAPKALTAPASSLRDSISMMCTLCKACNFRHHFSQWRLFPSTKDAT